MVLDFGIQLRTKLSPYPLGAYSLLDIYDINIFIDIYIYLIAHYGSPVKLCHYPKLSTAGGLKYFIQLFENSIFAT